ncbi:HU family DNA-binding protein [Pelagibacteraceae bacterium]|nr:HU family DNA-binding protein [Pelagibacteraceae bacterium]
MNNNYKKIDLIKNLRSETGFSHSFSKKIIDDLIESIIQNIKIGSLNIKNVGSFKKIHKKERIGRNPKTKEEFIISSRKSLSFISSKKIFKKLD